MDSTVYGNLEEWKTRRLRESDILFSDVVACLNKKKSPAIELRPGGRGDWNVSNLSSKCGELGINEVCRYVWQGPTSPQCSAMLLYFPAQTITI